MEHSGFILDKASSGWAQTHTPIKRLAETWRAADPWPPMYCKRTIDLFEEKELAKRPRVDESSLTHSSDEEASVSSQQAIASELLKFQTVLAVLAAPSSMQEGPPGPSCGCIRCIDCKYKKQNSRTVCARCRDQRCPCFVCGQVRKKTESVSANPPCNCTRGMSSTAKYGKRPFETEQMVRTE